LISYKIAIPKENMNIVIELTDQEKFKMYSKLKKKELIYMLIESNKNCNLLNMQIFKSEPRFYEPIITTAGLLPV
jgi:hypothetical protein